MTNITDDIEDNVSGDYDASVKKISLKKHTETLDKLYVHNKNLQRDLDDVIAENDYLRQELKNNTIQVSRNIFFIILFALGYVFYIGSTHINDINTKLVEMNMIMSEYKRAIEKTELYNRIIQEKRIDVLEEGD